MLNPWQKYATRSASIVGFSLRKIHINTISRCLLIYRYANQSDNIKFYIAHKHDFSNICIYAIDIYKKIILLYYFFFLHTASVDGYVRCTINRIAANNKYLRVLVCMYLYCIDNIPYFCIMNYDLSRTRNISSYVQSSEHSRAVCVDFGVVFFLQFLNAHPM